MRHFKSFKTILVFCMGAALAAWPCFAADELPHPDTYVPSPWEFKDIKKMADDKAAIVASDMAGKLTELGRAVQAASILSRLTPEGQLRFAAREIQKHNEKVEKSKGGLLGLKKKVPELTPEQTKEILDDRKRCDLRNYWPSHPRRCTVPHQSTAPPHPTSKRSAQMLNPSLKAS